MLSVSPALQAMRASNPYEQLIQQILFVESQPITDIENKKANDERFKATLSAFDSSVSALHKLMTNFTDSISNPFEARSASVQAESAFGATASENAAFGTHNVQVERLATTDTRITKQYSSSASDLETFFTTNGAQTFDIEVSSPTDADPDNRETISVTVDPATTTNEDILDEISLAIKDAMDAAVDAGTIAPDEAAISSVVNETTDTARISLQAGDTGFSSRLNFTDSANGLLALLELNTAAVASGTSGGQVTDVGTSETDSVLNAKFVLDGLTLYRASNQVTDALSGITLDLKEDTNTKETFTVSPDTTEISDQVKDFIGKYNSVLDFIQLQGSIDADLGIRGDFAGDPVFTNLRFEMRNNIAKAVPGQPTDGPNYLTDLGIEINEDGTLELDDEDALIAFVEDDANAVMDLFSSADGLGTRLETQLDQFLGINGIIDSRSDSIDTRIKRYNDRITELDERLYQREESLRQEFARVQEVLSSTQSQQGFLSALFV